MKQVILFWMVFFSLTSTFGQGKVITDSLTIAGISRKFTFHEPAASKKNRSLVFVLHGSGGNGNQMMERVPALVKASFEENFIAVFPTGYQNFWNECRKASPAAANRLDVDEQAFFLEMIAYFEHHYQVDRNQVMVIGTSGGGHMAYKLAMTLPDTFMAISVIIANLPDASNMDCIPQGKPVHMLITNGTLDKINPYEGGEVILNTGSFGKVVSTETSLSYWAGLAGYTQAPSRETLPDTDPKDGKIVEKYSYSGREKEVTLLKVLGGGHDYPNDIDIHLYSWEFFKGLMRR